MLLFCLSTTFAALKPKLTLGDLDELPCHTLTSIMNHTAIARPELSFYFLAQYLILNDFYVEPYGTEQRPVGYF